MEEKWQKNDDRDKLHNKNMTRNKYHMSKEKSISLVLISLFDSWDTPCTRVRVTNTTLQIIIISVLLM